MFVWVVYVCDTFCLFGVFVFDLLFCVWVGWLCLDCGCIGFGFYFVGLALYCVSCLGVKCYYYVVGCCLFLGWFVVVDLCLLIGFGCGLLCVLFVFVWWVDWVLFCLVLVCVLFLVFFVLWWLLVSGFVLVVGVA